MKIIEEHHAGSQGSTITDLNSEQDLDRIVKYLPDAEVARHAIENTQKSGDFVKQNLKHIIKAIGEAIKSPETHYYYNEGHHWQISVIISNTNGNPIDYNIGKGLYSNELKSLCNILKDRGYEPVVYGMGTGDDKSLCLRMTLKKEKD